MKTAEIVSVGDELLSGAVVDTNAVYLCAQMRRLGYSVRYRQTCGDREEEITFSLDLALSRSDLVIVTGGLGPTKDDLTRQVTGKLFDAPLLLDESVAQSLRAYFASRGISMSDNNLLQAQVPKGAEVLQNDWGTAPGLLLRKEEKKVILLPGVPSEMKEIFKHRVLPILKQESQEHFHTRVLRFYGIPESVLDEKLGDLIGREDFLVAPYAGGGEVQICVTTWEEEKSAAERSCETIVNEILKRVGDYCYGEGDDTLERVLVKRCREQNVLLATAESCTGGLLSQRITSCPGSSEIFRLGLCTYSEEEKAKRLGVSTETLSRFGVYSKPCALEMARGVRSLSGAKIGIGITGIAGPSGGTEENPVGTVYIAVVTEQEEICERCVFGPEKAGRDWIRRLASSKALAMALSLLS